MRHRLRIAGVATAVLCASCSAGEGSFGLGASAPDLPAYTLLGDTVSLASFRGEPVLLNLWATWCPPCRRETPYLQALHEAHVGRGLRVVGLSEDVRGSDDAIRAFMGEFGVTYTVLSDPDMVAVQRLGVPGLPATFVLDRDGRIRHVALGEITPGDRRLEAALDEILQ